VALPAAWQVAVDRVDPAERRYRIDLDDPETWLRTVAGRYFRSPFAPHHLDLWAWTWGIQPGVRPRPFVAVWNRGGAKSTSAEVAVASVGARRTRRYVLYVCDTQQRADDHVANIGNVLTGAAMERHHPEMARRLVSKYGTSQGWRRNRLRTASGFTVDALGLDVASRGIKLEDQRPDMIVLDDLDTPEDTEATTAKKERAITRGLIPAGSRDVAVLAVQNLIHPDGVFAKLADGRADYLANRVVSGPIPAVYDLRVERVADRWTILGGTPSWVGMPLTACQALLDDIGLTAFLAEAQHEVQPPLGGMWDHVEFTRCTWEEVPWGLIHRTAVWVDPAVSSTDSSDSFGIQADALDLDGTLYRLWSWEARTSPMDALQRAIRTAHVIGCPTVGVETDQGGDTWGIVYAAAAKMVEDELRAARKPVPPRPGFRWEKAGSSGLSKVQRASRMLADYERPGRRIVHVVGTHHLLERALKRFPKVKPFDLVDAAYWSWADLRAGEGIGKQMTTTHLEGSSLTGDLLDRPL
jgi:hypothetical protein